VQQKLPLLEMTELRITPQMPDYPKIAHDVFMLLLDGKMHSRTEILKFLKPLSPPPPPPPPPPPKRGRAAKAAAGAPQAGPAAVPVAGKKKGKGAAAVVSAPPQPAARVEVAKAQVEKAQVAKAQVAKASNPPKVEKHESPTNAVKPSQQAASGKKKTKGKNRR
jgi:hypothetical protein